MHQGGTQRLWINDSRDGLYFAFQFLVIHSDKFVGWYLLDKDSGRLIFMENFPWILRQQKAYVPANHPNAYRIRNGQNFIHDTL